MISFASYLEIIVHAQIAILSEYGTTLCDFFLSENESLASLNGNHSSPLAGSALELEGNLLGGLRLLPENGLGLPSKARLLGIVPPLALGDEGSLARLVLGDLVGGVLLALLAVCLSHLGSVDLFHMTNL